MTTNTPETANGKRTFLVGLYGIPAQTIIMTAGLAIIGLTLVLQTNRWERTPAYHNLLLIMSARTWGAVHLGAALLLFIAILLRQRRLVVVVAHTFAVVLVAVWDVGFIVRYLTDPSTTIVNPVSWSVYVFVLIRSAMRLDQHDVTTLGHEPSVK